MFYKNKKCEEQPSNLLYKWLKLPIAINFSFSTFYRYLISLKKFAFSILLLLSLLCSMIPQI